MSKRSTSHKKKKHKGRRKHIPQRTCVGCRTVQPKREMLRVVRTPKGTVEIDTGGKQAGRGAYLCQKRNCWEIALKRRSLNHALKTTLDDTTRAALAAHAQTLPESLEIAAPILGHESSKETGRGDNQYDNREKNH